MCHRAAAVALGFVATLLLSSFGGCSRADHLQAPPATSAGTTPTQAESPGPGSGGASSATRGRGARRIIRTAELRLEVAEPLKAQQRATEIAEQHGGFVLSTEARTVGEAGTASSSIEVALVLEVPSELFSTALARLHDGASRVVEEKVAGQDVSEEYVDVESELRAKRAVEAQFLEVLKSARSIEDTLRVDERLGLVRADVEKLEGRRRFLEHQTALATIRVSYERPAPLVAASGSGLHHTLALAAADLVDVSAGIVTALVRLIGWLVPVVVLLGLPSWGIYRLVHRLRRRRAQFAR